MDTTRLSFDELNPTRLQVANELVELSGDLATGLRVLGLSQRQSGEIRRNAELWESPTMPALRRYTGVLYDALDVGSLGPDERVRAESRLAICSALFGLVRGGDPIPAYRLSGGNSLPELGSLRAVWRPALRPLLDRVAGPIVDLRSGAYTALGQAGGAITVRVVSEDADGTRKTVSHHNKAYKGRLARELARCPYAPGDIEEVATVAKETGSRVERTGEDELCLVID